MIAVEFRRTIFSEACELRRFPVGATIAEIAAAFDVPDEFATHGAAYLEGHVIEQTHWHRVRPRAGTGLFLSCMPQGSGQGSTGKQVFALVGAIALIALTGWVGGGGLATLAPSLFGALTGDALATKLLAGAVLIGGMSLLSRPAVGAPAQGGSVTAGTAGSASAGIAQNPLRAYNQIPGVLGTIRVSPDLLARPWTKLEGNEQVVHFIGGGCGPVKIEDVKINETDLADMPAGAVEIETREGWPNDAELTLIRQSGFEENINLPMSTHRLDRDQAALIAPATGSYPRPHIFRSARATRDFRITLAFGGGLAFFNSDANVLVAYRVRVRRLGSATWIKLPELHLEASVRDGLRQEIWLHFESSAAENARRIELSGQAPLWRRFYAKNSEWTADTYFNPAPFSVDTNVSHVLAGRDGVHVHLHEASFPPDRYDVEIVRSYASAAGSHTDTAYAAGLFTYTTFSDPKYSIPAQKDRTAGCTIESYTSFRDEYPIATRGLWLIAMKVRNIRVNSFSAKITSYAPIWNGTNWNTIAATNNPASLLRQVWLGSLNRKPVKASLVDSLADLYQHAVDEGLSCNHLVTSGSVDDASTLIASCGDAVIRRSDKWGVAIDRDRGAEGIVQLFQPHNMTEPLTVQKTFVRSSRGLTASYFDQTADYAPTELPQPIFDDGVEANAGVAVEHTETPGYTSRDLVVRALRLRMRRARLRTLKYTWGVNLAHLNRRRGDLVGVAHTVLIDSYAAGRVRSIEAAGGDLVAVTLNTNVADAPAPTASDLYKVDNVYRLADLFNLNGPQIGVQMECLDGTIVSAPVERVEGATLYIAGGVARPAELKRGCLAAVGPFERETRRVIIATITPRGKFNAQIQAYDEANEIFAGLEAA